MTTTKYDTGRHRVYMAERAAHKHLKHHFRRFDTLAACQAFADSLTQSQVWQNLNGPYSVKLKAMPRIGKRRWFVRRRSLGLAKFKRCPDSGEITFSHIALAPKEPWKAIAGGWDTFTILHELAHAANPWQEKHGPAFLSAHLALMDAAFGPDAAQILKSAYLENGVKLPLP